MGGDDYVAGGLPAPMGKIRRMLRTRFRRPQNLPWRPLSGAGEGYSQMLLRCKITFPVCMSLPSTPDAAA